MDKFYNENGELKVSSIAIQLYQTIMIEGIKDFKELYEIYPENIKEIDEALKELIDNGIIPKEICGSCVEGCYD